MDARRPKVLFVGSQPLAALASLLEHGADLTVVAGSTDVGAAEGVGVARVVRADRTTSVESVLTALARDDLALSDFDVVAAQGEHEMLVAGTLKELSGCRGMGLEQALLLRDKYVQKRAVRDAGIAVADTAVVASHEDVAAVSASFPGRVVIKPLSGAGAHDTFVLADTSLVGSFMDSRGPSLWLLESFVDGREHHLDGIWWGAGHLTFAMSRDLNNMITVHDGALVGSYGLRRSSHPELYASAERFLVRALGALAQEACVFHCEFFLDGDGRLVFGECAGRVGGGKISDVLARQFDIDIYDEWARLLLGAAPGRQGVESEFSYGWANLVLPRGEVLWLPSCDEMLELPGVVQAELSVSIGDRGPDSLAGTDVRAGRLLVSATDEQTVEERLAAAADWFRARSVVAGFGHS